jgi:DNA invertase Pin-like site-specific DNA recombinase
MTRAIVWAAVSTRRQTDEEKASLPVQEADAQAVCAKNGWEVIEVLSVPGHSRRGRDIFEVAREMERNGINAFTRLLKHLEQGDFDILVCRDGDRFARSQSLFARVVEDTVIGAKARIYSMADGMVDEHNFRMWIAMCGYRAAGEVDKLVEYRRTGLSKRVSRGLPTARPVLTHTVIRDDQGKAIKMVIDESKRRLLDDLATLLLEGIAFNQLSAELYRRFGHINPTTGRYYSYNQFHKLLYNPYFWGHAALNYDTNKFHAVGRAGRWVYDENEPLPPGVVVHRNTHESAYTGDLAQRVQAELRRREQMVGKTNPSGRYAYSGLLICGECGFRLSAHTHHAGERGYPEDYIYWQCGTRRKIRYRPYLPNCSQRGITKLATVNDFVRRLLAQIFEDKDLQAIQNKGHTGRVVRLDSMKAEIEDLTTRLETMIREQAERKSATARELYTQQIDEMAERLDILEERYSTEITVEGTQTKTIERQMEMLDYLLAKGVETVMSLPPVQLNQYLHQLLADVKIQVKDRQLYIEL